MKKNTMMRIASLVLVLTLLSTCAISGTFAKYTTSSTDNDTAQVAKWGVTVSALAGSADSNAFASTYASDTDAYTTGNTVTAKTGTTYDLVAPGTGGTLGTVTVSGTPEVAVKMTYTIDFEIGNNWVVSNAFYCPIVVTIGDTAVSGLTYTDSKKSAAENATAFEEAVEDAIAAALVSGLTDTTDGVYIQDYAPNANLGTSVTPTWAWAYTASGTQTDANDTALGNLGTMPTISCTLSVDATQID